MIHPSRNQFPTTSMILAAANARHALESEPLPAFAVTETTMIPHGIPKSGTCKWQCEWKMADGNITRFPAIIRE